MNIEQLQNQLDAHITINDNQLYIGFGLDNKSVHEYSFKTILLPKNKNLITYDWIINKLIKKDYKLYYDALNQLAKNLNISNNCITTYGYMLSFNQYKTIQSILDKNNIEYKALKQMFHIRLELLKNKNNIKKMIDIY